MYTLESDCDLLLLELSCCSRVELVNTVKPALMVTSVKRSPAHNGQFLALPMFFTI